MTANNLDAWLAGEEIKRRRAIAIQLWGGIAGFLAVGAGALFLYLRGDFVDQGDVIDLVIGAVVVFGMLLGLVSLPLVQLKERLKRRVLPQVAARHGLTYAPRPPGRGLVPRLQQAGVLTRADDRIRLEDYFDGEMNGVRVALHEAHLQRRVRRDKTTYYKTTFRGFVAQFSFHKRFNARTLIGSDKGVFNWFAGLGGRRVKLEDPEFEKRFEVFSDDQVEARYLLTPGFMQRLVDLDVQMGGRLQLCFDGGDLLIAGDVRRTLFEMGSVRQPLESQAVLTRFDRELTLFETIIDTLNLDAQTRV